MAFLPRLSMDHDFLSLLTCFLLPLSPSEGATCLKLEIILELSWPRTQAMALPRIPNMSLVLDVLFVEPIGNTV